MLTACFPVLSPADEPEKQSVVAGVVHRHMAANQRAVQQRTDDRTGICCAKERLTVRSFSMGKSLRLERLSGHGDGRFLFVPLDHSVSDGPIVKADRFDELV